MTFRNIQIPKYVQNFKTLNHQKKKPQNKTNKQKKVRKVIVTMFHLNGAW